MSRNHSRAATVVAIAIAFWPIPATHGSPDALAASDSHLVFVDEANQYDEEVVRSFTPLDSIIGVSWTGSAVSVSAERLVAPGHMYFQRIHFSPPAGEVLQVGSYTGSMGRDFDGHPGTCQGGSFVVHALDDALEPGVTATGFEFAVSFSQTCDGREVHGEVRFASAIPASAVGYANNPQEPADLQIHHPGAIAGGLSEPGTILLRNFGTVPLTFGAPAFNGESGGEFQVSTNTCSSQPVEPLETCQLSLRARQWVPGPFTDHFTIPVSTVRGSLAFRVLGNAKVAALVPINPVRIVDTRSGLGIPTSLKSGQARKIQVGGSNGIPTSAVAVVGNLTITGHTSSGYASMTTSLENSPPVSTINTKLGDTRANGLIVRLTANGASAITWVGTAGSTAHAVFDATGYFVEEGSGIAGATLFKPLKTFRVVDTRGGLGISTSLLANQPRTFTVPLPSAQAAHTAVAANLTIVSPSRAGYLAVTPAATATPSTSTLNFPAGDTRANNLIARLGSNRTLSIVYKGPTGSRVHVVLDVSASFGSSGGTLSGYVPLVPHRVVDTRKPQGIASKLTANQIYGIPFEGANPTDSSRNIPSDDGFSMTGFSGNATIVGQNSAGYLAVYPDPIGMPPTTSTLNAPMGDVRANGVIVGGPPPQASAAVYFAAGNGKTTDFVFDVTGYFWPGG